MKKKAKEIIENLSFRANADRIIVGELSGAIDPLINVSNAETTVLSRINSDTIQRNIDRLKMLYTTQQKEE